MKKTGVCLAVILILALLAPLSNARTITYRDLCERLTDMKRLAAPVAENEKSTGYLFGLDYIKLKD